MHHRIDPLIRTVVRRFRALPHPLQTVILILWIPLQLVALALIFIASMLLIFVLFLWTTGLSVWAWVRG